MNMSREFNRLYLRHVDDKKRGGEIILFDSFSILQMKGNLIVLS